MNPPKESSVLFSLRELMSLEAARLDEERAEAERKAEEALASAQRARRAREEAEAARVRDETRAREEARAERDERDERDERARLAAIREAALERVRHEAAMALRAEAWRVEQTHEQALAARAQERAPVRLSCIAVGLFASFIVVIGLAMAATVHFRTEAAARDAAAAEQREAAIQLRSKLRAMEQTLQEQREALERLPTPPLAPVASTEPVAVPHLVPSRPKPHPVKDPGTVCAHEGDPICTQLP
jgi:hypothetical protein